MPINPVEQGLGRIDLGADRPDRLQLDQVARPLGNDGAGQEQRALPSSFLGGSAAMGQISFGDTLGAALNSVNEMQLDANRQAELLAIGQVDNPHDAIIALEKAHLALQLTANVIEKAIGAYKQISQMQI